MNRFFRFSLLAVTTVLVSQTASANAFDISFFNNSNNALVGTGTFSYTGDVGDGTFSLTSLSGYSFDFTVGSSSWTTADLATTLSGIEVVFYENDTNVYFSNDGTYGGPQGGSADFENGNTWLTFEPPDFGPPPLDLFQALDSNGVHYFGTFTTSPEPSTFALLAVAMILAALLAYYRRERGRA